MNFKRELLPFQLTLMTMAIYELFYPRGSITEREPAAVAKQNKKAQWRIDAARSRSNIK